MIRNSTGPLGNGPAQNIGAGFNKLTRGLVPITRSALLKGDTP